MNDTHIIKDALTESEKAALRVNSASSVKWEIAKSLVWGYCFMTTILALIAFKAWTMLNLVPRADNHFIYILFLCAILVGLYFLKMCWPDFFSKQSRLGKTDLVAKDLKEGIAHVMPLTVTRVIEILEYEDEGAGFFLELDDGRVLCVIGQDLYDFASDAESQPDEGIEDMRHLFPQTKIILRIAPHSGMRLMVGPAPEGGISLRPYASVKTTRKFFKKDKQTGARSYTGPLDATFYEGTLDTVIGTFGYKLIEA